MKFIFAIPDDDTEGSTVREGRDSIEVEAAIEELLKEGHELSGIRVVDAANAFTICFKVRGPNDV